MVVGRPTCPLSPAQGLAAGLMMCISVMDLMPAAVEELGFATASLWFYAGVIFFAVVVALIPEPSSDNLVLDEQDLGPAVGGKAAANTPASPAKGKAPRK